MASTVCAQPDCPSIVGPGGGVRGYCPEHANEPLIEAIEALTQAAQTQSEHVARIDLNISSLEDVVRTVARQRPTSSG